MIDVVDSVGKLTVRKIAIVSSHPVQYQTPMFDELAREVATDVYYAQPDRALGDGALGSGALQRWNVHTSGDYNGYYLNNVSAHPSVARFKGCDTPGVGELLRRGEYQGCVIFGWFLKMYWQAAVACRKAGIPVMVFTDSHDVGRFEGSAKRRAKLMLRKPLLRLFDGYGVPGVWSESYLLSQGIVREQIHRIPHSVDVPRFAEALAMSPADRTDLRARFGVSDNAFVILGCGQLVKRKRFADLFEAVRLLPDHLQKRTHIVLVGDGPERGYLQSVARSTGLKITFAGFCNQSRMPKLYALADSFALCSSYETWGLVVNESLASGVPTIVSSRVGAGEDLVRGKDYCRIYPVGNIRSLAESILSIAKQIESTSDINSVRRNLSSSVAACAPQKVAQSMLRAIECLQYSDSTSQGVVNKGIAA